MNHRGNDNAIFWNACGEDFFIREGEDSQNIEQHPSQWK